MTDVWYVIQPQADAGKNATGLSITDVQTGSAADTAYKTGQSVNGNVKVLGPYPTQQAAETSKVSLQVTYSAGGVAGAGPKGILGALTTPLTGLAAVGDFFQRLTQGSTWIRVLEVLLGVSLIAVGLAKISGVGKYIPKVV